MFISDESPVSASSAVQGQKLIREPLKYSGSLDKYRSFDHTPAIGTEFPDLQLSDILNDDAKLRDLAITVSRRGVVFLRAQNCTLEQQKVFAQKLGELTGKPSTSKLHRHVIYNAKRGNAVDDKGTLDDNVHIINSDIKRKFWAGTFDNSMLAGDSWHTDLPYEKVPADYSVLKMLELPADGSGGDTLWASGYEAYERLSPPMRQMAEGLKSWHHQNGFFRIVKDNNIELDNEPRGSPENTSLDFRALHPVIRTNPVTGWKSLYAAQGKRWAGQIEGLTEHESNLMSVYFHQLIANNHDLQVRFKWGVNDIAVWDNRSAFHCATQDYAGKRRGHRVASIAEVPYFDPASISWREALAAEAKAAEGKAAKDTMS